jgi:hypothetical protein
MNFKVLLVLSVAMGAIGLLGVTTACNSPSFSHSPTTTIIEKSTPGSAAPNAHQESKQVDILFVIDTQGSMSALQKGVADQIPAFIDSLNAADLDYQIAVTTMDMSSSGERGRFVGSPSILVRQTSALVENLQSRIFAGDYDWKPETRGVEAAMKGILAANTATSPNSGFLRPEARLMMIFVSNRDEASAPNNYAAIFDEHRPQLRAGERGWSAYFIGVLPDDQKCSAPTWKYAEPGVHFVDLVNKSGGVAASICDGDIKKAFAQVKNRVLEKVAPTDPAGKTIQLHGATEQESQRSGVI